MPNTHPPPLSLPDGRTVTRAQLAQELGIAHQTLTLWLKRYTLAAILARRPRRAYRYPGPDGTTCTQRALARSLGVHESTLTHRRHRARAQRPQEAVCYWCPVHQCYAWHSATRQPWQGLTRDAVQAVLGQGETILIETPCPACTAGQVERSAS